jgi:cytochrome c oxidase subunit 3
VSDAVDGGSRPALLRPSGERRPKVPGAGSLGLTLFLVSLGIFFAAALAAYLGVRFQAGSWPPPGAPELPGGLWWATLCIIGLSAAMQWGLGAVRRGRVLPLQIAVAVAAALAVVFLAIQIVNWRELAVLQVEGRPRQFAATFIVLTGLHALHVLGGLVPLVFVALRAWRGRYTWADFAGVRHCTVYWHFLGAVWLVLFSVLRIS